MTLQRALEFASQLCQFKRLATGSPCSPFPADEVADADVTFERVVTAVYKWYGEQLRDDIRHLMAKADAQERELLGSFGRLLSIQRNADQHADFPGAAEAQEWRDSVAEDPSDGRPSRSLLIAAFIDELGIALDCLCGIAARLARDPAQAMAWRKLAAATAEEEVRAVFDNIGRHPPQGKFEYAVRQFKGHPELRRAKSPRDRAQVAELVAVGVSLAPLSVAYDEILDEFGLIGDHMGYALLLLAHGVQASGFNGARLIPVLEGVWHAVQASGQ
jgi:hypothetical protein